MTRLVRFNEEAVSEYQAALEWYAGQRAGLEGEFQQAIDAALARIAEAPMRFPLVGGHSPSESRKCLVGRFPYSIMFRETGTDVRVLAVARHTRRPGFWFERH